MPRLYSFSTISLRGPGQGPDIEESFTFQPEYIKAGSSMSIYTRAAYAPELGIIAITGTGGRITTTTDGREFTPRSTPTVQFLTDITYGTGIGFLAVGTAGALIFSDDGINWIARTSPVSVNLFGCTYANGLFVIVGSSGNIWKSVDSINWTKSDTGDTTNVVRSIAWSGSRWHTAGPLAITTTSPTLESGTWVGIVNSVQPCWKIIPWSNDRFIACGDAGTLVVSNTGATSWSSYNRSSTSTLTGLVYYSPYYSPDLFGPPGPPIAIVCGIDSSSGTVLSYSSSSELSSWTNVTGFNGGLTSLVWNGREDLAIGPHSHAVNTPTGGSSGTRSSGLDIQAMAYSSSTRQFIAAGGYSNITNLGGIWYSDDGYSWTRATGLAGIYFSARYIQATRQFFVTGATGFIRWASDNSITNWSVAQVGGSSGTFVHTGIDYSPSSGYYATCTNDGQIFRTTTPQTQASWTSSGSVSFYGFRSLTYVPQTAQWIATGGNGTVRFGSDDASTWTTPTGLPTVSLGLSAASFNRDAATGNVFYVIVGDSGTILVSNTERTSWTFASSGTAANLKSVEWDSINNRFVAVGDIDTILISNSTATVWTVLERQGVSNTNPGNLRTVTFGNNRCLIGGSDNRILAAPIVEEPSIGDFYQGGYYAGKILVNSVAYAVILSPKAQGQSLTTLAWQTARAATIPTGTLTLNNGLSATNALVTAGDSPAANFCANLTINGYDDWYLPSRDELELIYRNLKPDTTANALDERVWSEYVFPEGANSGYAERHGINRNSRPNGLAYTASSPVQTPLTLFQTGDSEAMDPQIYWSSTGYGASSTLGSDDYAYFQSFNTGQQGAIFKDLTYRVRAVRRIQIRNDSISILTPPAWTTWRSESNFNMNEGAFRVGTSGVDPRTVLSWAPGKFFTFGSSTNIAYTLNSGASWNYNISVPGSMGTAAATNGSIWVMVGLSAVHKTSANLDPTSAWTDRTSAMNTFLGGALNINGIAWGNGYFVSGTQSGPIIYSTDGITWTKVTGTPTNAYNPIFDGTHFWIVAGDLIYRTTGSNPTSSSSWFIAANLGIPNAIMATNGQGRGVIYTPSDDTARVFVNGVFPQPSSTITGLGVTNGATYKLYFVKDRFYVWKTEQTSPPGTSAIRWSSGTTGESWKSDSGLVTAIGGQVARCAGYDGQTVLVIGSDLSGTSDGKTISNP